jgi:hypothetical protein
VDEEGVVCEDEAFELLPAVSEDGHKPFVIVAAHKLYEELVAVWGEGYLM